MSETPVKKSNKKFYLIMGVILAGCAIPGILLILWVSLGMHSNNNPDYELNVASVSWLPETASDISYYRSYSNTAYEFSISEADFKAFMAEREWAFTDITEPLTVKRCYSLIQPASQDAETLGEWATKQEVVIENGYQYTHIWRNGGGINLGYDIKKGRVFAFTNPR